MALNFPNSPVLNEEYISNGTRWLWNGSSWTRVVSAGAQGFQGAQGSQGLTGPTGAQGTSGAQGSAGAQGVAGAQGFTGATGAQGSQGTAGAQGTTGSTGAQGATGPTGAQGAQGTSGATVGGTATQVVYKNGSNVTSGSPNFTFNDTTNTLSVTNVSIAGTLTYEDVTNVDALGIITARTGVKVTAGGVDITAGGLNVTAGVSTFSGITTHTSGFFTPELNVSGVSTFFGQVNLRSTLKDVWGNTGSGSSVLISTPTGIGVSWASIATVSLQGPTGAQGSTGATGAQGSTGPTGAQGSAGAQGATGPTGAQGQIGRAHV